MNREEIKLLSLLKSGKLDGVVGDILTTSGGSTVWTAIKDGNPIRFKKGPGGKFFDGKENEWYDGKLHILEEWKDDSKKLEFLQKFGWLIENADVKAYSAKFKAAK